MTRAVRIERTEKTIGYWETVVFSKNAGRPLPSEDLIVRTLRLWRELFSRSMNLPEAEPVTVCFDDVFATPEHWMGAASLRGKPTAAHSKEVIRSDRAQL